MIHNHYQYSKALLKFGKSIKLVVVMSAVD